ncbi:MAG: hypothetical protein ABI145_10920 [Steroidobacteraceae bacterium]
MFVTYRSGQSNQFKDEILVITRSVLVAVCIFAILSLHELVHLLVGRMARIPAVFTNLTAVGLPTDIDTQQYGPTQLALMNGIAPLLTVVFGFTVYFLLVRRQAALSRVRYFFTWCAIFGVPYLGVQMMIIIQHPDYSGNGADSAAVAGYLHLCMLIRVIICLVGFLYYTASSIWVLRVIRAADPEVLPCRASVAIALWRRLLGCLLIAVAIISAVFIALRALSGIGQGPVFLVFGGWGFGSALLVPWKSFAAKTVFRHWLLPGIVGTLALIPLSYVDKNGNDYAAMWLIILPPVTAATLFDFKSKFPRRISEAPQ